MPSIFHADVRKVETRRLGWSGAVLKVLEMTDLLFQNACSQDNMLLILLL